MEPNKIESEFREKLNQRKMEPSERAWEQLNAMLDIAEKPKKKKRYNWVYVAASILFFTVIGLQVFKTPAVLIDKNEIVHQNNNDDEIVKSDSSKEKLQNNKLIIKTESEGYKVNSKTNNNALKNQISEVSIIKKSNHEQSKTNQKVLTETVIVSVSKNSTINVDSLLEVSEKSINHQAGLAQKDKVRVDATDLLNQVDGELDMSFREKVITKINKNYQTVKVAILNRNVKE